MGKDKEKHLVDARCINRHVASMNSLFENFPLLPFIHVLRECLNYASVKYPYSVRLG